nr:hypothetical protein CFP56_06768 [Quercus suber]
MCIELNLPVVIIELDAKLVMDLLKKPGRSLNGNDVIVADCKENLKKIPRTIIKHYFREANKCTDALARRGALLSQDFLSFSFPPSDVALLLSLDSAGTMSHKLSVLIVTEAYYSFWKTLTNNMLIAGFSRLLGRSSN